MDELIQILTEHEGTGTEWGMSFWTNACARKAWLDKEVKAAGGDNFSSYQARVGTCFHKIEELWLLGKLNNLAWPLNDKWDRDDPVQEALRVFSIYRQLFGNDEFDLVVAEQTLPQDELQAKLVENEIGLSPFTFQPDQVVYLTDAQAARFKEKRFVDLFPGYYMRDTKTHEKKDSSAYLKYQLRAQFGAYMRAWNAIYPDKRVLGMIVNDVICHSKLTDKESDTWQWKSFKTYVVNCPTDEQWASMRLFLKAHGDYIKTKQPNFLACAEWSGCTHFKSGACNRMY